MTAAMAMATGLNWPMFRDARLLAQARQRVIFPHEGNDRSALTPLAQHRGRNVRDVLGDAKALMTQLGEMLCG
ncbi:hypothetical protein ACVWWR_002260 [Bradyrhizobium sp. LM3.2]